MKPNKTKRKSNFIVQGSILAVAGMISRIIGLLRRVPLEHIIGDIGNGYYSAAYEIYSMMLIISCYSLPLAVSKVISARISKGQYKNAEKAFQCSMIFALVSGGIGCIIMEVFSEFLAADFILEPMSELAIKVLGPAILIVAVMGVLRGYFQGLGTMIPTAISQIIEQIFAVISGVSGAYILFHHGEKVASFLHNPNYSYAFGAAGATCGPLFGAVLGLIFLLFVYLQHRSGFHAQVMKDTSIRLEPNKQIMKAIVLTLIPVILGTAVYNLVNVFDQRIFNQSMINRNLLDIKAYNWGVYSGKYKVLINVPVALASAMSSSIVPVLTGLLLREEHHQAKEKIATAIRFTMIIAIPCAVGLSVLARPVITFLFKGEVDLAVKLLQIGGISVIFFTLSTLTNGILQGINRMKIPVIHSAIALVLHIIMLYIMLNVFHMNIEAVVYSNIFFALLICVLNAISIKKYLRYRQEYIRTFIVPLACSIIMGIALLIVNALFCKVFGNLVTIIISLIVGIAVYFTLMIFLKAISYSDLMEMPGGRKFAKIARRFHLL